MAKLKAFVTHSGFFEFAVAAPSMKMAADILGISGHAFKHGAAFETNDKTILAAVLKEPGIILKRAALSKNAFTKDAPLPNLRFKKKKANPRANPPKISLPPRKASTAEPKKAKKILQTENKQKAAAQAIERDKARKAATFEAAEKRHKATIRLIDTERARLIDKAQAENARWSSEREKLKFS